MPVWVIRDRLRNTAYNREPTAVALSLLLSVSALSPHAEPVRGWRTPPGACAAGQGVCARWDSDKLATSSAHPSTVSLRADLSGADRVGIRTRTCAERRTIVEGGALGVGGHVRTVSCLGDVDDSTPRHPLACAQPMPM
mmetsp:Transcript_7966/g.20460  ORF Transcript_7966/g.20460 Transcript_7966/m.20460 type:complete len:139 (-) Transcript_7966:65-481(-)